MGENGTDQPSPRRPGRLPLMLALAAIVLLFAGDIVDGWLAGRQRAEEAIAEAAGAPPPEVDFGLVGYLPDVLQAAGAVGLVAAVVLLAVRFRPGRRAG